MREMRDETTPNEQKQWRKRGLFRLPHIVQQINFFTVLSIWAPESTPRIYP
jgi:hypothetical protein